MYPENTGGYGGAYYTPHCAKCGYQFADPINDCFVDYHVVNASSSISYSRSNGTWSIFNRSTKTFAGNSKMHFTNSSTKDINIYCYRCDEYLSDCDDYYDVLTVPGNSEYIYDYTIATDFYINRQKNLLPQYVSANSSFSRTYNQQPFNLGASVSENE